MGEGGRQLLTTTLESNKSRNMQINWIGSAIPRGIISVDKKWRLKVANSFGLETVTEGTGRRDGRVKTVSDGNRNEYEDENGDEDRDAGGNGRVGVDKN